MVLNYVWFIFLIQNLFVVHGAISQQPLFHVQDIKFPLSAYDMKIVDATGRRVKLAGGNYAGSHMIRHCVNGLQCRPLRDIALDIRFKFKMNCIRLTYSLQMIYDNNIIQLKYLKANPQMNGKKSLEVFDYVIKTLTQVGLMVILNNHISTSKWCCSQTDGNGLWWTQEYPEDLYLNHAQQFAKRYKNNPRVIGMDLRNQIRKANNTQPTWGTGNTKTDWKRAAQITGQLILKQAPNWLIIIGGLNYQLDLSFIAKYPIKLSIPSRLVYSGHLYSFSWQKKINTYDQFKKEFFNTQTFVRALGYPFLLGQFGNNVQDNYWIWLMQYLRQTDIDWTYWSLDGFKGQPTDDQSYGVFTNDFSAARHPDLLADMITVGPPPKALAQYQSYIPSDYSSSSNVNNHLRQKNPQNKKEYSGIHILI